MRIFPIAKAAVAPVDIWWRVWCWRVARRSYLGKGVPPGARCYSKERD